MTNYHEIARQILLEPTGLADSDMTKVISELSSVDGCDYADMYFQYQKHETWMLDEGKVKSGSFNIEQGVGLRSVVEDKTAFAYSEDLSLDSILAASNVARAIGRHKQNHSQKINWNKSAMKPLYQSVDPLTAFTDQEKVRILQLADKYARAADPRVIEVTASLSGVYEVILIVNSEGKQVPDVRPLVRCNVSVIVEQAGSRERGSMGGGGRQDYALFTEQQVKEYAEEAVRQLTLMPLIHQRVQCQSF